MQNSPKSQVPDSDSARSIDILETQRNDNTETVQNYSNPDIPEDTEQLCNYDDNRLGDTVYSRRFINKLLFRLCEEAECEHTEDIEEMDKEFEKHLSDLWDMSTNEEVVNYLMEFDVLKLFGFVFESTNKPRLTEMLVGIMANMVCSAHRYAGYLSTNRNLWYLTIVTMLKCRDAATLLQVLRFIRNFREYGMMTEMWIEEMMAMNFWDDFNFILLNCTNVHLRDEVARVLYYLTDDSETVCMYLGERENFFKNFSEIITSLLDRQLSMAVWLLAGVLHNFTTFPSGSAMLKKIAREICECCFTMLKIFTNRWSDQFLSDDEIIGLLHCFQVLDVVSEECVITSLEATYLKKVQPLLKQTLEGENNKLQHELPVQNPLSRLGSFVTPTELLAQSSLGNDAPVSTGGFLCADVSSVWLPPARFPFLPGSRFPGNIIAITRQQLRMDHHQFVTAGFQHQQQNTHYRNSPLILKHISAHGSFILFPLRCLDKYITVYGLLSVFKWNIYIYKLVSMEFPLPESFFAQKLASCQPKIRTRALLHLRSWITDRSRNKVFKETELSILWKGLYYAMWMQDKPLQQEELADNIGKLMECFSTVDEKLTFQLAFFTSISSEWHTIDKWRLNKFMMLTRRFLRSMLRFFDENDWEERIVDRVLEFLKLTVLNPSISAYPEGLKFHFVSLYLDELDSLMSEKLDEQRSMRMLQPYVELLGKPISPIFFDTVISEVLEPILLDASQSLLKKNKAKGESQNLQSTGFKRLSDELFEVAACCGSKRRQRIYEFVKKFQLVSTECDPFDEEESSGVSDLDLDDVQKAAERLLKQERLVKESYKNISTGINSLNLLYERLVEKVNYDLMNWQLMKRASFVTFDDLLPQFKNNVKKYVTSEIMFLLRYY
ncbi:Ribosomal RNA processing protein 1 -like protein, partial [Trichinella sp. T9]